MSLVAQIKDGTVVESASQSSLSSSSTSSSSDMDKDSFLQLLVAEMQNQDPLEPTSNTEYITQYAQFSEVESLSDMANNMDLSRASSLVGQEVYMKTESSSGDTSYIQGRVDSVTYENNKAYLSINGSLYSLDDLDTVIDSEYLNAYNDVEDFETSLSELPNVESITIDGEGKKIDALNEQYEAMSDYEKGFVTQNSLNSLNKYTSKLSELRLLALTEDTDA